MSGFDPHAHFDDVERVFEESGLTCFTRTIRTFGHRCGYVALPDTHKMYGAIDTDFLDVDGGITFVSERGGFWVLGWDAGHGWHQRDLSIMDAERIEEFADLDKLRGNFYMVDADRAENETRKLARQLAGI